MKIYLNGQSKSVADSIHLEQLIMDLNLKSKRYAVEVNEQLIPKSQHEHYSLQEGDKVEIVQAIGGG